MEGGMKNLRNDLHWNGLNWNGVIQTLVCVRVGQELGTDSRIAHAVHDLLDAFLAILR